MRGERVKVGESRTLARERGIGTGASKKWTPQQRNADSKQVRGASKDYFPIMFHP